jgi:hypothetical protein
LPQKIFISYRREDSAANALGIGQYLEREFGRKNVFIDVDMRAGTNFPKVLEERLAECKVMLVLIGPNWLAAKDESSRSRLEHPNDWVRLEIASALKHNIAIIPVRINGTELPEQSKLPEDIRGLLNYQAVAVSHSGFRNEMASLVRDIRSITKPSSARRYVLPAVGACALLLLAIVIYKVVSSKGQQVANLSSDTEQSELWPSKPGEWVAFAADQTPVAHYFKPDSVRYYSDRVAFTTRFPLMQNAVSANASGPPPASYEQDIQVLDCKKSTDELAERIVFDRSGDVSFRFKWGDPENIDLSVAVPIQPKSILAAAQSMLCDQNVKNSIVEKPLEGAKLSFLSSTANGDGDIYYEPTKFVTNGPYTAALGGYIKYHSDQNLAGVFQKQTKLGFPTLFRTIVQPLQFDCSNRKVLSVLVENFDSKNNLVNIVPLSQEYDVKVNPFAALFEIACRGRVSGTYAGMLDAIYTNGAGAQKISITVAQSENNVDVKFETATGGQGEGNGSLANGKIESLPLKSTSNGCPGTYIASLEFSSDAVKWTYQGKDCNGPVEGKGIARRNSEAVTSQR